MILIVMNFGLIPILTSASPAFSHIVFCAIAASQFSSCGLRRGPPSCTSASSDESATTLITDQQGQQYAARLSSLSASTINCGLRTLRRAINLAAEWGT
jgi:hypothetical protein